MAGTGGCSPVVPAIRDALAGPAARDRPGYVRRGVGSDCSGIHNGYAHSRVLCVAGWGRPWICGSDQG